jgi:hypothetical protein
MMKHHTILVISGVLGVSFSLWLHKKLLGIVKLEPKYSREPLTILMPKKVLLLDAMMTTFKRLTGFLLLLMDVPSIRKKTDGPFKKSSKRLKF